MLRSMVGRIRPAITRGFVGATAAITPTASANLAVPAEAKPGDLLLATFVHPAEGTWSASGFTQVQYAANPGELRMGLFQRTMQQGDTSFSFSGSVLRAGLVLAAYRAVSVGAYAEAAGSGQSSIVTPARPGNTLDGQPVLRLVALESYEDGDDGVTIAMPADFTVRAAAVSVAGQFSISLFEAAAISSETATFSAPAKNAKAATVGLPFT